MEVMLSSETSVHIGLLGAISQKMATFIDMQYCLQEVDKRVGDTDRGDLRQCAPGKH
jgi:hypothetical protein